MELTVPRGLSLAAAAIKQKGTHREEQDRQSVSMDIGFFFATNLFSVDAVRKRVYHFTNLPVQENSR